MSHNLLKLSLKIFFFVKLPADRTGETERRVGHESDQTLANMVYNAPLRVLLLGIVLLSCIQSVVNQVDMNTLSRIQRYFHNNYCNGGQYAVAINVPKVQCQSGFNPRNRPFLTHDPSGTVKPHIQRDSMDVYKGTELIAAGFHKDAHSEYLLMNPPNHSPLTDLMNKHSDGCVVFYTLNSPCINHCLNRNDRKNIIQGLNKLKAYQGIKAFVFSNIYTRDQNIPNLRSELQQIADRVPLYRCNRDGCILCGQPNMRVIDQCLRA